MNKLCMHLTNYAINKDNENFVQNNSEDINSGEGSKRHLNWLRSYLSTNGHDDELLFQEIEQIIVKTMISVQPSLSH
jgi:tubulin polyglutamylase TTLL6/13